MKRRVAFSLEDLLALALMAISLGVVAWSVSANNNMPTVSSDKVVAVERPTGDHPHVVNRHLAPREAARLLPES